MPSMVGRDSSATMLHRMAPQNTSRWQKWMTTWNHSALMTAAHDGAPIHVVEHVWHDDDIPAVIRRAVPRHADSILAMRASVERNDMARYCLLYLYGGMYADLDVQLLSLPRLSQALFVAQKLNLVVLPFEKRRLAGQAIMLSPRPRHPFWIELIESLVSEYDSHCYEPSTTGPDAVTHALNNLCRKNRTSATLTAIRVADGFMTGPISSHHLTGTWRSWSSANSTETYRAFVDRWHQRCPKPQGQAPVYLNTTLCPATLRSNSNLL